MGQPAYPSLSGPVAPRVSWEQHLAYLSPRWQPGEHVSVIAPTGRGGKSFLITKGLLPLWGAWKVLYIDVKDSDPTLKGFGHRVESFPNPAVVKWAREPKWFRLHIRSALAGVPLLTQHYTVKNALASAYRQKGWVIVGDEAAFLAADLNLITPMRDLWKRGRTHITFIAATQSPRHVPTEMYDQPTYLYLGRLGAEGNKRLGEIGGTIDYKVVRAALGGVRKHEFLFIDKGADEPEESMQIVKVGH
jgi:hypothetical protein